MSKKKLNPETTPDKQDKQEISDRTMESVSGGISQSDLQKAANDAINLYGQVQDAAIAYEMATASAKLGKDKAKSISS